jgi:dihydropteroate synthase
VTRPDPHQSASGQLQPMSESLHSAARRSEPVTARPRFLAGPPEPASGLPEPASGLLESASGAPEPVAGLPEVAAGLGRTVSGSADAGSGPGRTASDTGHAASGLTEVAANPAQSGLPRPNRCVVMGVLNVTPDSFSDGGRYLALDDAVAHGIAMHQRGADLIDVGGESTRPGADRVDPAVESARVVPVIRALAAAGVPVSVDTTRARVAEDALAAGARIVNDVSGGLADPDMAKVVVAHNVPWILMHWRGQSRNMDTLATYTDVVAEVRAELCARVDAALAAGAAPESLVLDPGLGFAKRAEHDWALLRNLPALLDLGFPLLIGASRKRFLGRLLAGPDDRPRPPDGREDATAAVSALAAAAGAWGVRVHDVGRSLDAVAVARQWRGPIG